MPKGDEMKYRISNTLDAEERLEDAAMANAMRNALGCEIVNDGDAEFGRDRMFGGCRDSVAYWRDPAFLENAGREVKTLDVDGAEAEVKRLHDAGKDAFAKATELKLFTQKIPVGTSFGDAIGDYIWSLLDRPDCVMIQPFCDFRFEMRFVSIDRKIVTQSSVAWHLTPISRVLEYHLYETPKSKRPSHAPSYAERMKGLAERVAKTCIPENVIIDCAIIDGKPGVVEFNPFSIGNFRLYACDPHAIAQAYAKQVKK
jgi:hypothetical protein